MPAPAISLIPVRAADLAVGKPLPYAVYDWHGKLLLSAGHVLTSRDQLDDLIDSGYIHDPTWDLEPVVPRGPAPLMAPRKVAPQPVRQDESAAADAAKEDVVAMDDVRWTVGETLYLQQVDSPAIRHTVRLIGFVKNKTVFVTAPVVDGKVVLVRDGQTFVSRAFSGKKAYAFIASVVKCVHSPHPYLHLTYPKELRCTVVRRGARARVSIIAAVSLGDPERTAAATLTDLSTGGASAVAKTVLGEKGDEGQIKFRVNAAGQDEYLNLRTVLRSVTPSESGDGYKHGFEFLDVPMHARLILSAYVHQLLAEGD